MNGRYVHLRARVVHRRQGLSALYMVLIMAVLFAFASLAMDYGKVQLVKTELRTANDVACKWGVQWVNAGKTKALTHVNDAAGANTINGSAHTYTAAETEVGYWNSSTRVFTPNGKPQNAVRLTTSTQVPLAWGRMIGKNNCTVRAVTVAKCVPMGIVGLNNITFKNNTFIGSYDSSVTTTPTTATASSNAALSSNGYVGEKNNGDMRGDIYLGPSGTVDTGWNITGGVGTLGSALTTPSVPAWSPTGNPGGLGLTMTGGNLVGGTYWVTSIALTSNLTFTGPATIYVNGNININSRSITAYNGIPSNLKIYQLGASRTFTAGNTSSVKAVVIAPTSDFTSANGFDFYGMCFFQSIFCNNNAHWFYDENSGAVQQLAIVQ